VEHGWTYGEAKTGCPRDPGAPSTENQVVGKEVNKATQESAEGAMRGNSAAEATRYALVRRDFGCVACRSLIHDRQCSYGEAG